jgi:hypothetical protein
MPCPYIPDKIPKVRSKTHISASASQYSHFQKPHRVPISREKGEGITHAVADFSNPHSCTGTPLNKMKPLPSRISLLTVAKNSASLGKGKNSYKTQEISKHRAITNPLPLPPYSSIKQSSKPKATHLRHPSQPPPTTHKRVRRSSQLLNLLWTKNMRPSLRVILIILRFPNRRSRNLFRKFRRRREKGVIRIMLT